ncbi:MAG TPA: glycoside hydrolase family 32 protein [Puia sp.]|nr:glycoside hydrolase family 32 protein [Puia sp.]
MRNTISAIALSAALFTGLRVMGQTPAKARDSAELAARRIPADPYNAKFRPQFHFSPKEHWMNDPNGMVFFHGVYHLFFQYYPDDIVWGPMHWGHATSKDLAHWKEQPIALFPDRLGYIFSGSAVVDSGNTSGFGRPGQLPLVAIFTQHDAKGEKSGAVDFQNQSIAYSLDEGKTWTKYENNPVLKNPGIKDFRDPKVMWYAPGKKWVMTLAAADHIEFWSSPDLKEWKKESGFGAGVGAHGGVWECPDLFSMQLGGVEYWVLLVSSNPGGPNGGSGTQYFIGRFDGSQFHLLENTIKWIDYGPDDYAGVTWGNTGHRRIFLGWMSNWEYANQVPTATWRNAMTIPRELQLQRLSDGIYLSSRPVKEFSALTPTPAPAGPAVTAVRGSKSVSAASRGAEPVRTAGKDAAASAAPRGATAMSRGTTVTSRANPDSATGRYVVKFEAQQDKDLFIFLSNDIGEHLIVGYETATHQYYIDRSRSGKTDFNPNFSKKAFAPRLSSSKKITISLLVDASSAELFADGGLTVMTLDFFPTRPFTAVTARSGNQPVKPLSRIPVRSIWP